MRNLIRTVISAFLIFTLIPIESAYAYEPENDRTVMYWAFTAGAVALAGAAIAALLHRGTGDETNPDVINVTCNNIHFTEPGPSGQQIITITSDSTRETTINDPITFAGGAAGDRVKIIDQCTTIPANGTCTITLEAEQTAYDGSVTINYDYDNKAITSNIGVAKTTIALCDNQGSAITDIYLTAPSVTKLFKYVNTGNFTWRNSNLEWAGGVIPTSATLVTNNCENKNINPGDICTFELESTINDPGDWETLEVTGSTLVASPAYTNVYLGKELVIADNTDVDDLHLGYRSIKLSSTLDAGEGDITLGTLDAPDISGTHVSNIKHCAAGSGSDCYYKTTCSSGQVLSPGGSCIYWFKAVNDNNDNVDMYSYDDVRISIQAQGSWARPGTSAKNVWAHEVFKAPTEQALYVAGNFNYVTKYNGTNWQQVGDLFNLGTYDKNNVLHVRTNSGDLYVGGQFTSPASRIARWNGNNWVATVTNQPNNNVQAIIDNAKTDNTNIMYIGGWFNSPDTGVASCNGNNICTALTGTNPMTTSGVTSLAVTDNFLYIGGSFQINTTGYSSRGMMAYDLNNHSWYDNFTTVTNVSSLAKGNGIVVGGGLRRWANGWVTISASQQPNNSVHTLHTGKNEIVYVGGSFTNNQTDTNSNLKRIGQYNPFNNSFYGLGSGIGNSTYEDVFGITSIYNTTQNHVYAVGQFDHPGDGIAKWDEANPTAWAAIPDSDAAFDSKIPYTVIVAKSLKVDWCCSPDTYGGSCTCP